MLSLTVKKLDAFKFDGVAESDNTGGKPYKRGGWLELIENATFVRWGQYGGAFDSAKNHKRPRRKRQSVTAKREKSQTPKFV